MAAKSEFAAVADSVAHGPKAEEPKKEKSEPRLDGPLQMPENSHTVAQDANEVLDEVVLQSALAPEMSVAADDGDHDDVENENNISNNNIHNVHNPNLNTPVMSPGANGNANANRTANANESTGQIDSSSPFEHPGGEEAHLLWFVQQFGLALSPNQFLYQQRVMEQIFHQNTLSLQRERAHQ